MSTDRIIIHTCGLTIHVLELHLFYMKLGKGQPCKQNKRLRYLYVIEQYQGGFLYKNVLINMLYIYIYHAVTHRVQVI